MSSLRKEADMLQQRERTPAAARSRPAVPFTNGLGYVVRLAHKALSRRLAAELARHGIQFKHYYYLRALLETDGLSQMELSESVGVDPTTVVTVVDTLARLDIVERRGDPDDRRKSLIYLTARGKALRRPMRKAIEAVHVAAEDGISARDLETFRRIAARITENLDGA